MSRKLTYNQFVKQQREALVNSGVSKEEAKEIASDDIMRFQYAEYVSGEEWKW